jgi:hypothetical protein
MFELFGLAHGFVTASEEKTNHHYPNETKDGIAKGATHPKDAEGERGNNLQDTDTSVGNFAASVLVLNLVSLDFRGPILFEPVQFQLSRLFAAGDLDRLRLTP